MRVKHLPIRDKSAKLPHNKLFKVLNTKGCNLNGYLLKNHNIRGYCGHKYFHQVGVDES